MKTNKQNNQTGLESQSEQFSTNKNQQAETPKANGPSGTDTEQKDNRDGKCNLHPIDSEARKQNRTLPTPKVLNLLLNSLPDAYRVAEVVGKWVCRSW